MLVTLSYLFYSYSSSIIPYSFSPPLPPPHLIFPWIHIKSKYVSYLLCRRLSADSSTIWVQSRSDFTSLFFSMLQTKNMLPSRIGFLQKKSYLSTDYHNTLKSFFLAFFDSKTWSTLCFKCGQIGWILRALISAVILTPRLRWSQWNY